MHLLVLAVTLPTLAGASRPATAGAGAALQVESRQQSTDNSNSESQAYSAQLQSLVNAVNARIQSGLNRSYTVAVQEDQKYRALFTHLREGIDNFTRSTRHLQARIPQERLGELRAIEDALNTDVEPKIMMPMEATSAGARPNASVLGNASAALQQGTGAALHLLQEPVERHNESRELPLTSGLEASVSDVVNAESKPVAVAAAQASEVAQPSYADDGASPAASDGDNAADPDSDDGGELAIIGPAGKSVASARAAATAFGAAAGRDSGAASAAGELNSSVVASAEEGGEAVLEEMEAIDA